MKRQRRAPARKRPARTQSFAHLFGAVREGVFVGLLKPADHVTGGQTFAANPYLKTMFGYAVETDERDVAPFALERFSDEGDRSAFINRLETEGTVTDYLLRMRRIDGSAMWVEVTAHAEQASRGALRVEEATLLGAGTAAGSAM